MREYLESLPQLKPVRQQFRINLPVESIQEMLFETYKTFVGLREIPFTEDADTKAMVRRCAHWLTGQYKPSIMLYGTHGNGKTTMSKALCHLINYATPSEPVFSIAARDLSKKARTLPNEFDEIIRRSKLCIDDFGWEPATVKNYGNEINPIVEVIEERHKKLMLTILTSNQSDDKIIDTYGNYIYERLSEMCDMINYTHPSYRTGKKY